MRLARFVATLSPAVIALGWTTSCIAGSDISGSRYLGIAPARVALDIAQLETPIENPSELRKKIQQFLGLDRTVGGVSMPIADVSHPDLSASQLYQQAAPSVLFVVAENDAGTSQGSAVAISSSVAMTNCHVVMYGDSDENDPNTTFDHPMSSITIRDSTQAEGPAEILASYPEIDVCFIRSTSVTLNPVGGVVPFSSVEVGETVYTLGNPQGMSFTIASGIVSQVREAAPAGHGMCTSFIQHSAPMSPGSSGGALLDAKGHLLGITERVITSGENLNLAIPASLPWDWFADGKISSHGQCP
jgi:S1-C subfamily serine protease